MPEPPSSAAMQPLSEQTRESISKKLEILWEKYIETIHRFITLNTSLIVGVAGFVSFLPKVHGTTASPAIQSKGFLIGGMVLLIISLICAFLVRILAQLFMEYEVLQPRSDVDRYFEGREPFTQSYRINASSFAWQTLLMKLLIFFSALFFLVGLSLSVVFLYQNLP